MKYLIDTSSLMNHLEFVDFSEVVMPIMAYRELEKHKDDMRSPEKAARAREVLRVVEQNDALVEDLFLQIGKFKYLQGEVDYSYLDNHYLEMLFVLREDHKREIGLITHDRSLRKQAKAFGFEVKDYQDCKMESHDGTVDIKLTPKALEKLKKNMSSAFEFKNSLKLMAGQYAIVKVKGVEEMAVRYEADEYGELRYREIKMARIMDTKFLGENGDVQAKNLRQAVAIDSFHKNKLTIITGKAGSGKSYLALGYLLQEIHKQKNSKKLTKVYIVTNNVPMRGTSTFGLKKGDIIAKVLQSNLGSILKTKLGLEYTEMLIQSGMLNIVTLEDIRGASFDGPVYVTEAQNYTKDMMKTIIERMEEEGQLILDGDERQIDMAIASGINNGISRALAVFGGDELLGHVRLEGNMRGRISELADKM